MSDKMPYMALDVRAWMEATRTLKPVQRDAYMQLLLHAWVREGKLPADHKELAKLLGERADRFATSYVPVLEKYWDRMGGSYTNKKQTKTLMRAENARKTYRKRTETVDQVTDNVAECSAYKRKI